MSHYPVGMSRSEAAIQKFRKAPVIFVFSHAAIIPQVEPFEVTPNRFVVQTAELCYQVQSKIDDLLVVSFLEHSRDQTLDVLFGVNPVTNINNPRMQRFQETLDPKVSGEMTLNKWHTLTEEDFGDGKDAIYSGLFILYPGSNHLQKEKWMFPIEKELLMINKNEGGLLTEEIVNRINNNFPTTEPLTIVFSACSTTHYKNINLPPSTIRVGKEVGAVSGRQTAAPPSSILERERLGLPLNTRFTRGRPRNRNMTGRNRNRSRSRNRMPNRTRRNMFSPKRTTNKPLQPPPSYGTLNSITNDNLMKFFSKSNDKKNNNYNNNNANNTANNDANNTNDETDNLNLMNPFVELNTRQKFKQPPRPARKGNVELQRFLIQQPNGGQQTYSRGNTPVEITNLTQLRRQINDPGSNLRQDLKRYRNLGGDLLVERVKFQGKKGTSNVFTFENFKANS